jgi:hypothetical protein
MDENFVTQTLFWIASSIWAVLTAIVGFLAKGYLNKYDKEIMCMKEDIKENKAIVDLKLGTMIKDFQSGVDSLKSAVAEMKEFLAVVKTQQEERIGEIKRRLDDKKKWLEDHDETLDNHADRLTAVETDCKHFHKK